MSRQTLTATLIMFSAWFSMSSANAAHMFLNNQVANGSNVLCSALQAAGENGDTFVGPISGTASCGFGNYTGIAYSAVELGTIGGLGQPAMAQITATDIVPTQTEFVVQMGGQ
jgi:hypothetical protein